MANGSIASPMHGAPPALSRIRNDSAARSGHAGSMLGRSSRRRRSSTFADVLADPDARTVGARMAVRARTCRRADAQGRRADRRDHHLPPGGRPVHRQADRAGEELRRAGRHRYREHAAAQRAARVAAAADRHRRGAARSSVRSPGDLEPVFEAMLANATPALRGRLRQSAAIEGRRLSTRSRCYGVPPAFDDAACAEPLFHAAVRARLGQAACNERRPFISPMLRRRSPIERDPRRSRSRLGGARTCLACRCSRKAS